MIEYVCFVHSSTFDANGRQKEAGRLQTLPDPLVDCHAYIITGIVITWTLLLGRLGKWLLSFSRLPVGNDKGEGS